MAKPSKKFLDEMWKKLEPNEPVPDHHDISDPISIKRAVELGVISISPKSKYFTETGERKEAKEESNDSTENEDI